MFWLEMTCVIIPVAKNILVNVPQKKVVSSDDDGFQKSFLAICTMTSIYVEVQLL